MNGKIPYRNPSGCADPTAQAALSSIQHEQDNLDQRVNTLIKTMKNVAALSGFDLISRIEVRDKTTGKCFR